MCEGGAPDHEAEFEGEFGEEGEGGGVVGGRREAGVRYRGDENCWLSDGVVSVSCYPAIGTDGACELVGGGAGCEED